MNELQDKERRRLVFASTRTKHGGRSTRICGLGMILMACVDMAIRGFNNNVTYAVVWIVIGVTMIQSVPDDVLLLKLAKLAGIDVAAMPRDKHTPLQIALVVCGGVAAVILVWFYYVR